MLLRGIQGANSERRIQDSGINIRWIVNDPAEGDMPQIGCSHSPAEIIPWKEAFTQPVMVSGGVSTDRWMWKMTKKSYLVPSNEYL